MDFASGLANLQKVAASSSSSETNKRKATDPPPGSSHSNGKVYDRNNYQNNRNRHPNRRYHDTRPHLSRNEQDIKNKLESLPPYNIDSYSSPPTYHLVLLFLTIDDLPFEHIWRAWMDENHTEMYEGNDKTNSNKCMKDFHKMKVSVLCHAKFPYRVKSPWLQKRLLRRRHQYHSYKPEWGSVGITRAMIDLLMDGLNIHSHIGVPKSSDASSLPPPDRFLFVSESCLPIRSLEYFYEALYQSPKTSTITTATAATNHQHQNYNNNAHKNTSWINARSTPNNGYSRQLQFDRVNDVIARNKIWKADQWMLLSRQHAEAIKSLVDKCPLLWAMFKHVKASDEIYFPTLFALLGIFPSTDWEPNMSDSDTEKEKNMEQKDSHDSHMDMALFEKNVLKQRVTYCDWSDGDKNPVTFTGIRQLREVVIEAQKEGCLVARKFKPLKKDKTSMQGSGNKNDPYPKNCTIITVKSWSELVCTKKTSEIVLHGN